MNLIVYLIYLSIALCNASFVLAYGVNGGIECAACTILAGVFGQVAEINKANLINSTLKFCDHLFWPSNKVCRETTKTLEPLLSLLIQSQELTPDTFCYGLNFCHQDPGENICYLFPPPPHQTFQNDIRSIRKHARTYMEKMFGSNPSPSKAHSVCALPGLRQLCDILKSRFNQMEPAIDPDGDKFSVSEKWRGSNWRGRDCFDLDSNVYPGRQPLNADVNVDSNCNGIWGLDNTTGIPWETKFCGDHASTSSRGVVIIGDSVGAHFHFPSIWFNPSQISGDTFFKNSTGPLLDELDWPQYSFSTGFKNITEYLLIQGDVDSIYLRMRRRNLCNHRDYQNICRNGATSFNLVENVKNLARNTEDKPVTVLLGVLGNDVCNRFPNTLANMTTPKQFYKNMKTVIEALEIALPTRSHVILIGLVNGSFIYDTLANRLHPIGEFNGDVRYKNVFKWFECMQISPCNGWLSENKSIREETTKRAIELSLILKDLASNYVSKTISLSYLPNPLSEVMSRWQRRGGEVWQLFEPVDGFHPNQIAQPIIADILWRNLKSIAPDAIGPINKFNSEILEMFGDQGGH